MHYEAVTVEDMRTRVVNMFLGACGKKLNAETTASCRTTVAQDLRIYWNTDSISAVK